MPLFSEAKEEYPEIENAMNDISFEKLASETCIKQRYKTAQFATMAEAWNSRRDDSPATSDLNEKANIRRLIRMYDYLKWHKNRALSK